jgi:hypothetical protein
MNKIGSSAGSRLPNRGLVGKDNWHYNLLNYMEDGIAPTQGMRHPGTEHFLPALFYCHV